MSWYQITNIAEVDSPALVIYKERVEKNIDTLIASINDIKRLRPHIKTHKSAEVTSMMVARGITKFKCATIAEAEMLSSAGATDILLAYQPVGPKVNRLRRLVKTFPSIRFSCLIDNIDAARSISEIFMQDGIAIDYFVDLNVGMNRTGIPPEDAVDLIEKASILDGIRLAGLHVYDGHLRDADFAERKQKCDAAFKPVETLFKKIRGTGTLTIVAGGTPTYSIHALRSDVECSPGTFIYWDKGYEQLLQEQHYLHAALVVTRVISIPGNNFICIDLGHKSIASENPLTQRVFFIDHPSLVPVGHSEEHMVLKTEGARTYRVGDVLYGIPYHVCPTIALYERANVVQNNEVIDTWATQARNKKINV